MFLANFDVFFVAAISASACLVIVALKDYVPRLSGRSVDLHAVQAMHVFATPRVGGLAVFLSLLVSGYFLPASIAVSYDKFIAATAFLFMVGILEDLGFDMSPRRRILAIIVASLLVILMFDVWIPRTEIPGLDAVIANWYIGVPLTLAIIVGITNGFNLIDGVNGLCALTAIVAFLAISQIAQQGSYVELVHLCQLLAAGTAGFFLINYPFGKIFLGDAGAYTLGFVLTWFCIAVLLNVPDASPWALLLTLFWPVADTLLAIYRRLRRGHDTMQPDRLHVHQMVMRSLEICFVGRENRKLANPLTTLVLAPFVATPPVFGVLFWDQSGKAFAAVLAFGLIFWASYLAIPPLIQRYRRRV